MTRHLLTALAMLSAVSLTAPLTNHSRPIGTLTAIDPKTGDIVATVELEDTAPEGAAADGKGHIFVNNESKNTTATTGGR